MYWLLILALGSCVCCWISAAPSEIILSNRNKDSDINEISSQGTEDVQLLYYEKKKVQDLESSVSPCSTAQNNSCTTANETEVDENFKNDTNLYTFDEEVFSKTIAPEGHRHDLETDQSKNTINKSEICGAEKLNNISKASNTNEIKHLRNSGVNLESSMNKEVREGTIDQSTLEQELPSAQESSTQSPPQILAEQQTITQAPINLGETVSEAISTTGTKKPVVVVTTKKPKPIKPKPVRVTTSKPLAQDTPAPSPVTVKPTAVPVKPTTASTNRYPCRCASGTCSCCTGIILENFNVPLRSRACANVTYEPDDFAFNFKLAYNNRVLYNRRMSAKNPRPACIPINRYFGIKMCAKLYNVYMSGRNVHACLDFEGTFDDETAFNYSFNCFRIGSSGVAIVRPEDGGGLPPPPVEEEETEEDYDDSARGWVGNVEAVPN